MQHSRTCGLELPECALAVLSGCVWVRQDTVNYPVHIKNFNLAQLRQLCKELRSDIIHTVSKTGGEFVVNTRAILW